MTGAVLGRPQLGQEGTLPSFLLKLCNPLLVSSISQTQPEARELQWSLGVQGRQGSGVKRSQGQTEIINTLSMLALGLSPVWGPDEKEYTLGRAIRNSQC